MAHWNFDGDFYADEEPVYRGVSLAPVPLPFSDPLMDHGKAPPMPKLTPAKMPIAPAWPTSTAPAPSKADGAATVQAGGTPESLRERLVELLREEGEVVVARKEKPGVWKAKVQLFSDERHEALTLGLRVQAGPAPHWSTAEFRRYRGDAVLFAAVLQRVRAVVEGAPSAPALPEGPVAVGPADVLALLQLAEVCPEDAVAQLARVLDRLDDQAVCDLQVDVAAWLASSEVGVVGAACAVASRIQAPVRSLALHEAVARLQNADTLAGRLLLRLVLALPDDSQTSCKDALRMAGSGLDAETHRYIAEICA